MIASKIEQYVGQVKSPSQQERSWLHINPPITNDENHAEGVCRDGLFLVPLCCTRHGHPLQPVHSWDQGQCVQEGSLSELARVFRFGKVLVLYPPAFPASCRLESQFPGSQHFQLRPLHRRKVDGLVWEGQHLHEEKRTVGDDLQIERPCPY